MKALNLNKEILEEQYERGYTIKELAKELMCSKTSIRNYFKKFGIKSRNKLVCNNLLLKENKLFFIQNLDPNWIVGFTDGEGSFMFKYSKRNKRMSPHFSISQKDPKILKIIKSCFPLIVSRVEPPFGKRQNTFNFKVSGFKGCFKLLPFFDQYQPIEKNSQYSIWKFLMIKLLNNDFNHDFDSKIMELYRKEKRFKEFQEKFKLLMEGKIIG